MFRNRKNQNHHLDEDRNNNSINKMGDKINENFVIHTIPEKFLSGGDKSDQAKKTGIIILGLAAIFLIIMVVILYIILFQSPKTDENNNIVQNQTKSINQTKPVNNNLNTEKEKITPPIEKNTPPVKSNIISTSSAEVINEDIATSTPDDNVSTSTPETETIQSMLDTDNDGLNDSEEDLLGTNKELVDSDGDGYDDFSEVANLYNPAGDGKLVDNLGVDEYINSSYNYSVLYPSDWQMNILGSDDSIVFKSRNNDIFQIYVQPNSHFENITTWYEREIGQPIDNKNIKLTKNWTGIHSDDDLILYLTDRNYNFIYTLLYIPEFEKETTYKDIFQMMTNSLEIKDF